MKPTRITFASLLVAILFQLSTLNCRPQVVTATVTNTSVVATGYATNAAPATVVVPGAFIAFTTNGPELFAVIKSSTRRLATPRAIQISGLALTNLMSLTGLNATNIQSVIQAALPGGAPISINQMLRQIY